VGACDAIMPDLLGVCIGVHLPRAAKEKFVEGFRSTGP
jgi:hypothetical protein